MPIDKSHYSFFIALTRQLAEALENDDDDDVAINLSSLAISLELLLADWGTGPVGDSDEPAQGVEDDDAPGDDTPLGVALARVRELERDTPPALDVSRRRLVGGGSIARGGEQERSHVPVARQRRRTPVLKGKRRGKK